MKTSKNLYPQIYDFENLYVAYRRARLGKRDRVAVASFEFDLERNLLQLQSELRAHSYTPGRQSSLRHGWIVGWLVRRG
jgi:RNA-directed DNA polymerase